MAIQIHTAAVSAAADRIDAINRKIRDELSEVDSAVQTLQHSWEGSAANSGINKYGYLKRSFSDARFSVVDGLVSFMRIQVVQGYEATEQALITAASAFK